MLECNLKKSLSSIAVCRQTKISRNSLYKEHTEQDCTFSFVSKQNGNKVPSLKRESYYLWLQAEIYFTLLI